MPAMIVSHQSTKMKMYARHRLTRIILDTHPLDAILDISESTKTGDQPAVSKISLLDIASVQVLHEGRVLVDLMDSLDRLGYSVAGAYARPRDVEFVGSEVVETVALDHFQVPILAEC
jgi:hypothetical protein